MHVSKSSLFLVNNFQSNTFKITKSEIKFWAFINCLPAVFSSIEKKKRGEVSVYTTIRKLNNFCTIP